jgi:NADH dehydrogenase FAD-containing subunit
LNIGRRYLNTKPQVVEISDATMSSTRVVILGGGVAGIATAHKLMKHVAPKVKGLTVTLVTPSTHAYWNYAAVRGVIPGEIPDAELFRPIEPGFDKYPKGQFQFVVGTATGLDLEGNAVRVQPSSGPETTIAYDQLVIATGSSLASNLPFKTIGSYNETIGAWHDLQAEVKAAKSIVVAGAGATGVETIAELAYKYGTSKKLTLIIDGDRVLSTLLPSVSKAAESELTKMKVELVRKVRVTGVEDAGLSGKKLTLSDGKTLSADLYLPLYGVRPNTGFIPPHLLDSNGNLKLQKTLQVVGHQNVWGVGDVGNVENKQAVRAEAQVIHLFSNLQAVLVGNAAAAAPSLAEYKPAEKTTLVVTLGPKKGTGQIGTFKVFSFLVAFIKGKTIFMEKFQGLIEGKNIIQGAI